PETAAATAPPIDHDLVPPVEDLQHELDEARLVTQTDTASRPDWVWLLEILLVWLNAVHGVSERVCTLILSFFEVVAGQGQNGGPPSDEDDAHDSQLSSRLTRVRRSLWQKSSSVRYALCPVPTCWTPHLLDSNVPHHCKRCN
ncbi:hypothetical protein V8E36_006567, partial [Tilletia maclaganii]